MKIDRIRIFRLCLLPAALLALWWAGSASGWWNSYILPSPVQVWDALADMARSGELAEDLWASVRRVLTYQRVRSTGTTTAILWNFCAMCRRSA